MASSRRQVSSQRLHARAPLRDAARAAHELETYIEQNDAAFAERPDLFPLAHARRLTQDSRLAFAIARPVLLARGALGFVRRCHGDLHLRNIALIDGEPTLFDAVEFSDDNILLKPRRPHNFHGSDARFALFNIKRDIPLPKLVEPAPRAAVRYRSGRRFPLFGVIRRGV